MVDFGDHYRTTINNYSLQLNCILDDPATLTSMVKAQNILADLEKLILAIEGRPEVLVLRLAAREYKFALLAAVLTHYRHAHSSLRLFLELALSSVHFSTNELSLRKWIINSEDINWRTLIDPDTGVYAKSFVKAFSSGLEDESTRYRTIAEKVYRECSEFVHGNLHTHENFDSPLEFQKATCSSWIERIESVWICFLFAWVARYLHHQDRNRLLGIESLVLENFGSLPSIQSYYSGEK